MTRPRAVELPVRRRQADWGAGDYSRTEYFRSVLVDPDGTVRAWDEIADSFSMHHDLTPEQVAEARRLAGL